MSGSEEWLQPRRKNYVSLATTERKQERKEKSLNTLQSQSGTGLSSTGQFQVRGWEHDPVPGKSSNKTAGYSRPAALGTTQSFLKTSGGRNILDAERLTQEGAEWTEVDLKSETLVSFQGLWPSASRGTELTLP